MAAKKIFTVPVIIAFVGLLFPLLATLKEHDPPDLNGYLISDEKPELTRKSWFSGEYQEERGQYNDGHWAWKETMVRLNNQLYYDLFNQIRVKGFVIGKEDYIFSESYIFSAYGDDLVEEKKISEKMRKARVVKDSLKKKNVDLLLVFAPGKGVGAEEFIEDKYRHDVTVTNHTLFKKYAAEQGLNVLDLYTWFNMIKNVSPYPLFPRFGHHWSYFGECLAVDTILSTIETLTGNRLPGMVWDNVEVTDTSRHRDADVLKSMNLWRDPPQRMRLAYPDIGFVDSHLNTTKVLTISDSYWYGPVYMGVPNYCFANGQFWYYFNKIIPRRHNDTAEVWQTDLKREIESSRVIMLLYSDGNLPTFGSGFIEEAYLLYTDPAAHARMREKKRQVNTFAKQIRESPVLLRRATDLSERNAISLDSAIVLEAIRLGAL